MHEIIHKICFDIRDDSTGYLRDAALFDLNCSSLNNKGYLSCYKETYFTSYPSYETLVVMMSFRLSKLKVSW